MKMLGCGDRHWTDYAAVCAVMTSIAQDLRLIDGLDPEVIEGEAPGADTCVWNWAMENSYTVYRCHADWRKYGKAAGPIRNQAMLEMKPDVVVAFHRDLDKSRGTRDMVYRAMKAGVDVFHWDGEQLVGLTMPSAWLEPY